MQPGYLSTQMIDDEPRSMTEAAHQNRQGIVALWVGVLKQAIRDFYGVGFVPTFELRSRSIVRFHKDAKAWFESDRTECPSFLWVCEILNLDPAYIRKSVFSGSVNVNFEESTDCQG